MVSGGPRQGSSKVGGSTGVTVTAYDRRNGCRRGYASWTGWWPLFGFGLLEARRRTGWWPALGVVVSRWPQEIIRGSRSRRGVARWAWRQI